jgi:tetratricopeptide (TPR) repeat protein
MFRSSCLISVALALAFSAAVVQPAVAQADTCSIKDFPVVTAAGVKLTPVADIDVPELRAIDAQFAVHCNDEAVTALAAYAAAHPDDYRLHYYRARLARMGDDEAGARMILREVLKEQPDFDSARILLASIALRAGEVQVAKDELAKLKPRSPRDLWGFIHEKSIVVMSDPGNVEALAAFLSLAENEQAQAGAREIAVQRLRYSGDAETAEKALRLQLTFRSQTPLHMKQVQLAQFLQQAGRADEARALLEGSVAQGVGGASGEMLARDYLVEAHALSPTRTDKNAALVAKADAAVQGDWTRLRARFVDRSDEGHLLALAFAEGETLSKPELDTALCRTGDVQNPGAMRVLLEQGGDPNIGCNGMPPGSLLSRAAQGSDPAFDRVSLEMLQALLDHGAKVSAERVERCASNADGTRCARLLLDDLKAAARKNP